MDFDFKDEEKAIFKQVGDALDGFMGEHDGLETPGDTESCEKSLRDGLRCLAPTAYLNYAIDGRPSRSGSAAMMAAMTELSSRSPSLFLGVETSARLFGRAIATWGSEEQKVTWLNPIIAGEAIGTLALSEATTNVVNDELGTLGERKGDNVVVNGTKGFVINGPVADSIAVVGKLDDGVALYLIEKSAKGVTVGERFTTPAYAGTTLASVTFEDCQVPAAQVIGPLKAEVLVGTLRKWENQILTGASLGLLQTAVNVAKKYSKTHKTAAGKPIIKFQEVSFKLADMLTLMQTAQLLAYRAAWADDHGSDEAAVLGDCAKVFCAESAETITSQALQILGTAAFTEPNAAELAFRSAKLPQIAGTSSEIARVQIGDDALRRWG